MIQRSLSLKRRLEHEVVRAVGSLGVLVYYKGEMPQSCELGAAGQRIESAQATEALVRELYQGMSPNPFPPATYWRLLDNNGNVVMQGDGG
jgi:hypothetical protein